MFSKTAGQLRTSRWHFVPIMFAYALTSFAMLVLFFDTDISFVGTGGNHARILGRVAWATYVQLQVGLFTLAHSVFLSRKFGGWRTLRWTDLYLASAAAAGATAYLFFTALRIVLAIVHGPVALTTSAILAVMVAAVSAFVVLTAAKRLRTEKPSVTSRSTALAISPAFLVSCFVLMLGASLLPWRQLHIVGYELGYQDYVNPPGTLLMYWYLELSPLIVICAHTAILLWFVHAIVLTAFFRRWRGMTRRALVFGSIASGVLTVIVIELIKELPVERIAVGSLPSLVIVCLLTAFLVVMFGATTFATFDALARKRM